MSIIVYGSTSLDLALLDCCFLYLHATMARLIASQVVLFLLLLAFHPCHAVAEDDFSTDGGDAFDWFSLLQGKQADTRSEEGVAQALVMMAAIKSISGSLGEEDGIIKLLVDEAAAGTRDLSDELSDTLGADIAGYHASDIDGAGRVHINLGNLLQLSATDLDARLAATAAALKAGGKQTKRTPPSQPPTDISAVQEQHADATRSIPTDTSAVQEQHADATRSTPPAGDEPDGATPGGRRLQGKDVSIDTNTVLLRNGSATITAADIPPLLGGRLAEALDSKLSQFSALGGSLDALIGVDWSSLQARIQDAARRLIDRSINKLPRIKAANRLEQIFQILVDKVTGGEGLGQGCTPYVFNAGGNRLPETILFPSFSISQTTGNCVLIPEFIGNTEYPGQWSLLNNRVACLGPSTEYLLLPAFYRSAATASEAFTCPSCRNEFSVGPTITVTLIGDSAGVVRYRNKAEFLAALKTNKTFGWGNEGLHGALVALKAKLQQRQGVFRKYFGGDAGDVLGAKAGIVGSLATWVSSAWDEWKNVADDVHGKQMRNLLSQDEQWQDVIDLIAKAPGPEAEANEHADPMPADDTVGEHEWRGQLNAWLQEAMGHAYE